MCDDRRGVEGQILRSWQEAEASLLRYLDTVGASEDAHTAALSLRARPIDDPNRFVDWLDRQSAHDETWALLTTTPRQSDGQRFALAQLVSRWGADVPLIAPFVEIHTRLIAWWLCYAWRARQLATALASLADANQVVAAAACARPLVETAAAFWVDARKLSSMWDAAKQAGPPGTDQSALERRNALVAGLNEVQYGAKFDDRAPDAKKVFGQVARSNVLGQVEKLDKATSGDLQTDYQWLCNTVHPSIGNTFAFSAPPLGHRTGTHSLIGFAYAPLQIESSEATHAERTVQTATARAATTALQVLRTSFDAALRVIDDLALTTRAPTVAAFPYWRAIEAPGRNDLCPCRSGAKSKRCPHEWGPPGPRVPDSFR